MRPPKLLTTENAEEAPRVKDTSEDIFKEIGEALRARREKMDLELTDVEHFTNLKRMYLIALEDGRFADLPSTVQGRGMLNNYAQFLAMDESSVMDRYAEALQLQREERMPPPRRQVEPPVSVRFNLPEGVRRVLNPDLVVGSAIIIALFVFILWGAAQIISTPNNNATEAPSISEMLQITQTVTPTVDLTQPGNGTPIAEDTPVPGVAVVEATQTPIATVNAAPLQLYIIANDRAYMRISVDGQEVFNGRVAPDNSYTYSGNTQITLLTGNAAALEVYFNQDYLGPLGSVGEVVNLRFAPTGLSTATPEATQTPSPTSAPPDVEEEMMDEGN
jgi:cytoskeletal protein RodZ